MDDLNYERMQKHKAPPEQEELHPVDRLIKLIEQAKDCSKKQMPFNTMALLDEALELIKKEID